MIPRTTARRSFSRYGTIGRSSCWPIATTGSDDSAAQQRRRPRIDRWVPLTAPIGARVVETPDDGGYVRLADGTVWEVNLPDRPITDAWHAGDYVTVSRVAAAGDATTAGAEGGCRRGEASAAQRYQRGCSSIGLRNPRWTRRVQQEPLRAPQCSLADKPARAGEYE